MLAVSRESVLHKGKTFTPTLDDAFGEVTTRIVIFLLYPLLGLYRFHSAVVAYEILNWSSSRRKNVPIYEFYGIIRTIFIEDPLARE